MGNNSLTVELFTELSVGIVIFGVRFYTRWRTVGFRGYGLDDAAAGVAVVSVYLQPNESFSQLSCLGLLDPRSNFPLYLR